MEKDSYLEEDVLGSDDETIAAANKADETAAAASAASASAVSDDLLLDSKKEQSFKNVNHSSATATATATASASIDSFAARRFRAMARHPWYHLLVSLVVVGTLSCVGMVLGDFSVAVDNAGWQSRGTLIANRHTQVMLVLLNRNDLRNGGDAAWQQLEDTVQPGWSTDSSISSGQRRLLTTVDDDEPDDLTSRPLPFIMTDSLERRIQESPGLLEGCDTTYYTKGRILQKSHLWPVWQTKTSALDPQVIQDICHAEQRTQAALEQEGLCRKCTTGRCLPPYSLVFFARLQVGDTDFSLTCDELANAWTDFVGDATIVLQDCVEKIKATYSIDDVTALPDQCPVGFFPTMVDEYFGPEQAHVEYTSSIFATDVESNKLYEIVDKYDRAKDSKVVLGAYDTAWENFVDTYVNDSVYNDMILAMGSALVTALAVVVHTRSPWITLVGLVQIILSFPLAFFVYTFIARLEFFPFLNFIGVFVVFALGADDIFVAVDKWKNARIDNQEGTVEDIAAVALPDAAGSMFLTTITTAVAFFATAICPVAPLKCFAVFCGLLVVFDYCLCILLVFPALCIYDSWLAKGNNCCCSIHVCKKRGEQVDDFVEDERKPSLIRRILLGFYAVFHKIRWILLVCCVTATVVSCIFAARLELPQTSDVRLLKSSVQYEQAYEWRRKLLHDSLQKSSGAPGYVFWGVTPADTGDYTNPASFTQLVLDDSFDPSTTAGQEYMVEFCDRFFAQDFANLKRQGYICPINRFNAWLDEESNYTRPSYAYRQNCNGTSSLPMSPENFNSCLSAWVDYVGETGILVRKGVVEIMYIQFQQRVRYDSPYNILDGEWHQIEDWMKKEVTSAPNGVNNLYHSSVDFWWYDTNGKMLQTAFQAAGIALGFSGIVVLVSSRSVVLTLFSVLTIGYVLAGTTAMLVASGWTLGFLESICFAILIGISCDFVIHFGHAYAFQPGKVCRHERTKYALIRMGPSILAAAFTTICAAIIMLFTVISFFRQFAQILFYTVLQATIGSFVVYLTLTDCIGPEEPTYLVDTFMAWCGKCYRRRQPESPQDDSKEAEVVVAPLETLADSLERQIASPEDEPKEGVRG